jgi:energy-coupling factor transporter ATP-binding protein EcfA2
LLKAIEEEHVVVLTDDKRNLSKESRFYDFQSFTLSDPPPYEYSKDRHSPTAEKERAISQLEASEPRRQLIQKLEKLMFDGAPTEPNVVLETAQSLFSEGDSEARSALLATIHRFAQDVEREIQRHPQLFHAARTASETKKVPVWLITSQDIRDLAVFGWGQAEMFRPAITQLFATYRNALTENRLSRLANEDGDLTQVALDNVQFEALYGRPPWLVLNETFEAASLDLSLDPLTGPRLTDFTPVLRKRSTQQPLNFGELSSGEKVLVSLAMSVYQRSDTRQTLTRPSLLLLDEIDATLHPEMAKQAVDATVNGIVNGMGVPVIMTTHSATTVAFAPEGSVYVMERGTGLSKSSQLRAINTLFYGVRTVQVLLNATRTVLVESPDDEALYEMAYDALKSSLGSELSLEFRSTGIRTSKGDVNTGCDRVIEQIAFYEKTGRLVTFGLVDWDGHHKPSGHLRVLGCEERNGIENVILDPLLLACLIVRRFPTKFADLGLTERIEFIPFLASNLHQLQAVVDCVAARIFGGAIKARSVVTYYGAFQLRVDTRCLVRDDHEYAELVIKAFPYFKDITRGRGALKLMESVVDQLMRDESRRFIPMALVSAFTDIINYSD